MTTFQIILISYLSGGIISNLVGYIGKEVTGSIRKEKQAIFNRGRTDPAALKFLHFSLLTIALRGIVLVLWFPLWIVVAIDYHYHPERYMNKNKEKVKPTTRNMKDDLYFFHMGGHGEISCKICSYSKEITCFTHGFGPDSYCTTGYQCQDCGEFHMIENPASVDFDEEMHKCQCGGTLSRNDILFCPNCKQKKLEYRMIYIT